MTGNYPTIIKKIKTAITCNWTAIDSNFLTELSIAHGDVGGPANILPTGTWTDRQPIIGVFQKNCFAVLRTFSIFAFRSAAKT